MPASPSPPLLVWGRINSGNVQKVLWCLNELDLAFERVDAGMQYGRNGEPPYLAMNPNGRVPTLQHGDFTLWESNAIVRYLALCFDPDGKLYPAQPQIRAGIERWLDWVLSTLQPAERPLFWGAVRTPPAQRDLAALRTATDENAKLWAIIDHQLAGRAYLEGDAFSLADLVVGCYARRWFGIDGIERPDLVELSRWYDTIARRPGFVTWVAPPLT
ncbi:MAG: glutathione S-transferase [Hyphomicrobiales bacterium]|nr:glutathione S-transferase [Hyphomicrobiales bacterium]